jgi:hypothetical protein
MELKVLSSKIESAEKPRLLLCLTDIGNCAKSVLSTLGTAQRVSYQHWELRKEHLIDVGFGAMMPVVLLSSANTLAALQIYIC